MSALRVAVIGAECTGKTSLCAALVARHRGLWVPEALREFVDRHGRAPQQHEQHDLMREQMAREAEAIEHAASERNALVAFDSAPLVTALYSELYFADRSLLPAALAHHRTAYDATLLAGIDLPWEPDGVQRDGPQQRARFHALLVDCLIQQAIAHATVEGLGEARVRHAERALGLHLRPR